MVHRSQHDPLITDETAPQHVLVEAKTKSQIGDPQKRKKEQQKFGIFYEDDYDYLQHLREPSTNNVVWEYVENPNQQKSKTKNKSKNIQLPSSVFATEYEEDEGMLNKAAPCPGPKPDWDPDVVAALDDDFDFDNPENEMEDDFVLKAMGEENENKDDENEFDERDEDEYEEEGDVDSDGLMYDDDDDDDENDEELRDRLGPLMRKERTFSNEETKSHFTEYSLTSSVIRRNEQLQLLDERFEKFYQQYDEPEIGALDMENIEGHMGQKHPMVLNCYRTFKKNKECEEYKKEWDKERLKKYLKVNNDENEDNESSEEMIEMEVEDDKKEKWDCESLISTYSSIYNRPKLIEEPKKLKKKEKKIEIDPKTGIPMNVLKGSNSDKLTTKTLAKLDTQNMENDDDEHSNEYHRVNGPKSLCAKSVISTLSVLSIRPKDETPEEKKERKKLLKEYRQERRIERKANTQAFKEEKKRQEKIKINQNNIQGNRIL